MKYEDEIRLDKKTVSMAPLHVADEQAYWNAKTPAACLRELELNRSLVYGYGETPPRLQRVFEFAKLK